MYFNITFLLTLFIYSRGMVAQCLERRTDDRDARSSNPAGGTSLRNCGNSVYPTLPVSFGGDTKSSRFLLCGVHARRNNRSHKEGKYMCNLS